MLYDERMYYTTADDFHIDAEDFGSLLPENWENICPAFNAAVDEHFESVLNARAAADDNPTDFALIDRLADAFDAFIEWKNEYWDHQFWDEHPEFRET